MRRPPLLARVEQANTPSGLGVAGMSLLPFVAITDTATQTGIGQLGRAPSGCGDDMINFKAEPKEFLRTIAVGASSRSNRVLDPLHTVPGAGHAGADSPRLHLDLTPFCPLLKEELRLGFVAGDAQVGVLERLPFLALPGVQPPGRFFA